MKRTLFAVFAVMLVAALPFSAGCGAKKANLIVIELEENPSTGFSWSYQSDAEGVLRLVEDAYTAAKGNLVGAPGVHQWTFEPVGDGTVTLAFQYAQSWDGGMQGDARIFRYEVTDGVPKLLSEELIEAPKAFEQLIRVDKVYEADGGVRLDAVYLNSAWETEETPDGPIEYDSITEVDGTVHTLTLDPGAYIAFSPDLSPETEDITTDQFVARFAELGAMNGVYYSAVIAGDTVSSLVYYYVE